MIPNFVYLLLILFLPSFSVGIPVFLRGKLTGTEGMVLSVADNIGEGAPEQWYDQLLDHLDPENKNTWKQRYWVNDSNWDRLFGPVFLFIGGESEETNAWLQFGEMIDLALKYHGLAIVLEHRFYGKSRPTKDLSLDSLHYLSSQQALADIVRFRFFVSKHYNMSDKNRWIAYGGSYSGALAAWVRIKYPDSFFAAVATSAPIMAEFNFKEYFENVENSLLTTNNGKNCVSAIHSAVVKMDSLSRDPEQWKILDKTFSLVVPLKTQKDIEFLSENVASVFIIAVQYNNNSRQQSPYNMNHLCQMMVDDSLANDPLDRLAYVVKQADYGGVVSNYSMYLTILNNSKWDYMGVSGARQWLYQTCNEFGYFETSYSEDQLFGDMITIDLYTTACQKLFYFSPDQVQKHIKKTNQYYGGKNISKNTTNIVFPNGSIDPWHALGIIEDISPDLPAVYINGTSHCANMYAPSKYDPPELVKARVEISSIIGRWLAS